MIKISLITICYNAESTLLPTLESVARQTYPHIEYIVVDGASRDNSLDLVRSICPEALITSEPDRGLYDAMNKGICRATGDYIWFLNAGDSLRGETTVQEVVEAIEQGSAPDIVYGDTMIVDEERKELGLRRLRPPHNLRKKDFLRGMLVCHQAFVVARRIVPTTTGVYGCLSVRTRIGRFKLFWSITWQEASPIRSIGVRFGSVLLLCAAILGSSLLCWRTFRSSLFVNVDAHGRFDSD